MTTLALNNVCKSYGAENVLNDISFDVNDGEMIVIVGPSGCGKSSLLRMVAGLEVITDGEVLINDKVVNNVEPKDRDIAMVFQNYALYPHMTVFKNMAYGLKLRGFSTAKIEERVSYTAELLGLESLLERKPSALSGGQRQRVAMGRAIVREPAIFLFDEPLSNLDAKLRIRMRLEIKALQRRLGVTSLYVTHDQTEAMTLADRLIILNDGHIEQIDTPMNVYQKPASTYVASFIGTPSMNLLEGKLQISGDDVSLVIRDDLQLSLEGDQLPAQKVEKLTLGIRPDELIVCSRSDADIICRVTAIETLGSETLVHCILDTADITHAALALVVKLDGRSEPKVGDELPLSVNNRELHLFESSSGQRVCID